MDKAIEYSSELIEEQGQIIDPFSLAELKFNLATAYNLRSDNADLPEVIKLYTEALETGNPASRPFIHNNLGMAYFFNFLLKS